MSKEINKVNVIVAKTKLDCEHLLGTFLDDSHYDILVEEDTDCYMPPNCDPATVANCEKNQDCSNCAIGSDERRVAFKFRKNYFSKEEQRLAYEGLRAAAQQSQNRGLAAGPKGQKLQGREWVSEYQHDILDALMEEDYSTLVESAPRIDEIKEYYKTHKSESNRGNVWLSSKTHADNFVFEEWLERVRNLPPKERKEEAQNVINNYISMTTYANPVFSGVAGYYDRYPRIPYGRPTAYTKDNYEDFKKAFPFLQTLNKGFKELMPWRWSNQKAAADSIDSRFLVPETVFTTITVNKTFRTAAHYDAGDLHTGLSNLLVLSNNGNYTGGYLVFPEYRVAVNVRPGDLLLVNNHEVLHGNTPIVLGDEDAERISLVCYFRDGMFDLGSWEYEQLRYQYVEDRRHNKEHKHWRPLWNGISPKMWNEQEWYDYLLEKGGQAMLDEHKAIEHKEMLKVAQAKGVSTQKLEKGDSLESLFG